ncbi:MAG: hypothetical protein U9R74_16980 [Pseudomonadota bacterium]|nr:hypothetical protein [Pseudomonadota bacterium]
MEKKIWWYHRNPSMLTGIAALFVVVVASGMFGAASAETIYSNEDFHGTYAHVGKNGDVGRGIGTCVVVSQNPNNPEVGSFTCNKFILSGVGGDNITFATIKGNFIVNANGTGFFNETITDANGGVIAQTASDFVITDTDSGSGVIKDIFAVQRQDGSDGLLTSTFQRLSD